MFNTDNPFKHSIETYSRDFGFEDRYQKHNAIALSKLENISFEDALSFIKKTMESSEFKEKHPTPNCNVNIRGKEGDRKVVTGPFLAYLDKIDKAQLGMSPTLASYKNPHQELSLIAEDIAEQMDLRDTTKKRGLAAKQAGNKLEYALDNSLQNAIKVGVNTWSGMTLSASTPFVCKSGHSTMTTCCRITTAICTALAERILAGKRYYYSPKVIMEDLLFTIETLKREEIANCISKFNLHVPTADEIMGIIRRSSSFYFFDEDKLALVVEFVGKLDDVERCAIAYTYDIFHLAQMNDSFTREFLTKLTTYNFDSFDDSILPEEPLKLLNGDQVILTSNLLQDDLAGKHIKAAIANEEVNLKVKRVAVNIVKTVDEYRDLITTFFRVDSHPLHVGSQNDAIRLAVPLGDTDSSLFTPKLMADWFYGKCTFEKNQEPLQDGLTYIVTQVWEHALAMFTAQMGVVPERRGLLIMKNEFKMPALEMTPVAKTYHAYVKAQEGLVFDEGSEYELKGSRFHASKHNTGLIKPLHEVMRRNLVKLSRGEMIDRGEVVDMIYRLEKDIYESMQRVDNPYLLREKIKPADEYANPNSANYVHYPLWQRVFAPKYGDAPEPQYSAYKVPVQLNNKTEINKWLESLPPQMAAGFNMWRDECGKNASKFTNFKVPMEFMNHHAIPMELIPIIDYRRIIGDILDPYHLYLSSMDIHLDYDGKTKTLKDMLDVYEE